MTLDNGGDVQALTRFILFYIGFVGCIGMAGIIAFLSIRLAQTNARLKAAKDDLRANDFTLEYNGESHSRLLNLLWAIANERGTCGQFFIPDSSIECVPFSPMLQINKTPNGFLITAMPARPVVDDPF